MTEKHRTDRLLPFTDAVVAIAMTLLVLPLVDLAGEFRSGVSATEDVHSLARLLGDHVGVFLGLTISFFVIARLWWAHHAVLEHVDAWSVRLVVLNVVWLFTIVLLPVMTAFSTAVVPPDWLVVLIYVGTMTWSSAMLSLIARLVVRDELPDDVPARERYYGNLTTTITFAIALVVCLVAPWTYYFPLALLALTGLVDRRVKRRLEGAQPVPERSR